MKAYLAGPDVFLKDAKSHAEEMKSLCEEYGIIPLHPCDNNQGGTPKELFNQDKKMIDDADIVIVNLSSYAGALVDDGTAWEIGYAFALGKKIYGYLNNDDRSYNEKIKDIITDEYHATSVSNHINLMLEESLEDLVIGNLEDILKRIKK